MVHFDGLTLNDLSTAQLSRGQAIRFIARGRSMWPTILDGDRVTIAPAYGCLQPGHVVCVFQGNRAFVHRVVAVDHRGRIKTRGDALTHEDGWFQSDDVVGRLVSVRRQGRLVSVLQTANSLRAVCVLGQCRRIVGRFRRR